MGSISSGIGSWEGPYVRTKGMVSPSRTVNSATVVMASPRISAPVRSTTMSGPAMARSTSPCRRVTQGTVAP